MTIRISNNSVSAIARSYALAPLEGDLNVVVWLELAPQHPKVLGAIWASLVAGAREPLRLFDGEAGQTYTVRGLNHRYLRKAMDAPRIAGRARPKFLRLVAPEMLKVTACTLSAKPFYVGEWTWRDAKGAWRQMDAATALAAMLEQGTHLPIRIGWGPYLLAEAVARGCAVPLVVGGRAPHGYVIQPASPWDAIISDGVQTGQITLEGKYNLNAPQPSELLALPQTIEA